MKFKKQNILSGVTFLLLIILLIIQVSYIYRAALLEEKNFNHRVMMALKGARDDLSKRVPSCSKMQNYLCGKGCASSVVFEKTREVDSIINANLELYNIELPYTFEVVDSVGKSSVKVLFESKCYVQNLNGVLERNGIQIAVKFPDRNQFLLAQLGTIFTLSILSILFIMISFFITQRMIRKEKLQMIRLTDFINNMVHEFQTPLSNIQFATHLIRKNEQVSADEKLSGFTSIILDENAKLKGHVENILRVACADNCTVGVEEIDINSLIGEVAESYRNIIQNKGGALLLNISKEKAIVLAEGGSLRMLVSNLVDNAIKYSLSSPTVAIVTDVKQGTYIMYVSDNGIGIASKDLSYVFEKHFRVSTGDVHTIKGFGLGLTYVKKIVELYNGTVSVVSEIGKGTTFTVELPLKNEDK